MAGPDNDQHIDYVEFFCRRDRTLADFYGRSLAGRRPHRRALEKSAGARLSQFPRASRSRSANVPINPANSQSKIRIARGERRIVSVKRSAIMIIAAQIGIENAME